MKPLKFFILIIALFSFISVHAQRPGNGRPSRESIEKLRAMKVGMITEKISLTEEQAKGFWPIYNRFDAEKRLVNQTIREQMRAEARGSEQAEIARQDAIFKLRQQEVELAKKYRPEFLKVISASQYSDLLLAEKEFNQMLLRELRERRNSKN